MDVNNVNLPSFFFFFLLHTHTHSWKQKVAEKRRKKTWVKYHLCVCFLLPSSFSLSHAIINNVLFLFCLPDGEYLFVDPENKLGKYAPKGWKSSHASVSFFFFFPTATSTIV
jgi:hypothetical protein